MDKRIKVTPDELAIIEGLRQEKAIWNSAIVAAAEAIATLFADAEGKLSGDPARAAEAIIKLRRA